MDPEKETRAEALRPSPSLIPKYFPPSRSSEDRKIPRAAGPAPPRPRPSHQRSLMAQTLPGARRLGWGQPDLRRRCLPSTPVPTQGPDSRPGRGAGHRQVGGLCAYPRVEGAQEGVREN